jgi:NPCBM-associated, NEW3 domain of alpha-galactosidase
MIDRRLLLAAFLFTATAAFGQGMSEAERRLDLARAQLNERQAGASLDQTKKLFAEGLASQSEMQRASAELERARLDTEKARVGLANDLPSFQVLSAVKQVSATGETRVELRLRELERGYGDTTMRGYLVSVAGGATGATIIGDPYQREVRLGGRGGQVIALSYRLLRDADEVTILLQSGTRRESIPILLQRDQSEHRVQLTSPNPSQDGTLGGKVEYALQLERFSSRAELFGLDVQGLPAGFTSEWVDSATNARIGRVSLIENQASAKLVLRVFLPPDGAVGATLPLRVAVSRANGEPAGTIDLQLRPVGAPKLALSSENLLIQLAPGASKTVSFTVENLGVADAHDVRLESNLPIGIEARFEPASIATLPVRERQQVRVQLTASEDAVPAEYNLKVKARTPSRLSFVESPELSFRVDVRSAIRLGGSFMFIALALATVGAVGWGIRRTKR